MQVSSRDGDGLRGGAIDCRVRVRRNHGWLGGYMRHGLFKKDVLLWLSGKSVCMLS